MDDLSHGPSESPVPGSDVADPIRHVGSGWYEVDVDGEVTKVRGEDAALQLLGEATQDDGGEGYTEVPPGPDSASEAVAGQWDEFRGPAMSLTLSRDPDPSTLYVDGPRGAVDVRVDGRTVARTDGHFGRGRWIAFYRPA